MPNESSPQPEAPKLSPEESWVAENKRMEGERKIKNDAHCERYIGKKGVAVVDITSYHGVEVVDVAKKGEIVEIIDANLEGVHNINNDVKIKTQDGREEWIDHMCLRVQE